MEEAGKYLFAIGVAIADVGLTLLFQGFSLHQTPEGSKIAGWAYALSAIWVLPGAYFVIIGIAALLS